MKKLIAILFIAGCVLGAYAVDPTLTITGNVASALSISLNNATATLAIDNTGAAVTASAASTITLKSNQKLWTITLHSANAGLLKDAGVTDTIIYKVQVDGSSFANIENNLSSYSQLTSDLSLKPGTSGGKTPFAGKDLPINIQVPAYTSFINTVAGTTTAFTDTITVTLASA
jgi:hypothetical protein